MAILANATATKVCAKCGQSFDLTPEHFFRSSGSPDGFARKCKTCYRDPSTSGTRAPRASKAKGSAPLVTESGYVASLDLIRVFTVVVAARDESGHAMQMMFLGPSGSGKTRGAEHLASMIGADFVKVDATSMTDPESWFGTREVIARDGVPVTVYRPSTFVQAIQRPCVLLIDEVNRIRDEHRNNLLPFFDHTHRATNPLTGEEIVKHPDCVVIMSGNRGLQFTGTYAVDPALMTRALIIDFAYQPAEIEERIAVDATQCDPSVAKLFVRFANETRSRASTDPDMIPVSTREVIAACRLVAKGLNVDLAASVAIVNGASDEGDAGGVKQRLIQIWAGIRQPSASVSRQTQSIT